MSDESDNEKKIQFLKRWLQETIKDETPESLKQHIIKHAHEINEKPPELWSASMRNLIDQFDEMFQINPDVKRRLERLQNKYDKDPKRFTPPPKDKEE